MKRLRVILLFLLLGAIVNVAVAWGCAIFVNLSTRFLFNEKPGPALTSETGASWLFSREDYFGSTILVVDAILVADLSEARFMEYSDARLREYYASLEHMPHVPSWSQFADPPILPTIPNLVLTMVEESRGWPFRTLTWFETYHNMLPRHKFLDVRKHVWIVRFSSYEFTLPFAPIWRGILLNTLFYALLLRLLFAAHGRICRLIRRKRGLCMKCAYDLRGAEHEACPECGVEVMNARSV